MRHVSLIVEETEIYRKFTIGVARLSWNYPEFQCHAAAASAGVENTAPKAPA
jgi:hypothetical protein